MNIPQEVRERIFALYWGQCIAGVKNEEPEFSHQRYLACVDFLTRQYEKIFLEVTPLDQITDEDAIEVARLNNTISHVWNGQVLVSQLEDTIGRGITIYAIDFLRSRGYALPAFGYTVQQLVDAGIFKLKTV